MLGFALHFTLGDDVPLVGLFTQALTLIPWAWVMLRRPDGALPNDKNAPFVNDMRRLLRRISVVLLVIFGVKVAFIALTYVAVFLGGPTT